MKKRCMAFMLCALASLVWASVTFAATVKETSIDVNGRSYTTPVMFQNDHQLVPAEFFKHIQAKVQWNADYQAAVIHHSNGTIGFPSGERYADYLQSGIADEKWQRDYLNTSTIDQKNGTFIPLAYTVRKLGMEVHYDAASKKTWIRTNSAPNVSRAPKHANIANTSSKAMIVNATTEDVSWLYKMTEAEAGGESYEGKVAVAASILNRVKSEEWPDTIEDTLFQVTHFNGKSYYQYSPVLDKRIYNAKPSEETKRAVQAAKRGEDPSQGATLFYNPDKTDNEWVREQETTVVIGNHVFAKTD